MRRPLISQNLLRLVIKSRCDQLEDPALAKAIVKRDITRIVTPGLLLEDETLTAGNNNYLLALWGSKEQIGLAALDLSTGDFVCTVTQSAEQVFDELLRLSPSELVLIDDEWHGTYGTMAKTTGCFIMSY